MPQIYKVKTKTISASEAKLHLGQYLNEVCYGKQIIIIEKMGKVIAEIKPPQIKETENTKNPWDEVYGMWKNKKPDPIKLLRKMRKYKSRRTKELEKLGREISKRT